MVIIIALNKEQRKKIHSLSHNIESS